MDESVRKRIREIVDGMSCPKDFKCAESGFRDLCCVADPGLDSFLKCLEEGQEACRFRIGYGTGHYCSCPLRVYLAKKLADDSRK